MDDTVRIDWKFVDFQLKMKELPAGQDLLVRKLLHTLEQVGLEHHDLPALQGVLETVVSLSNGYALHVDLSEQWVDAVPGDISNRDRVRVKRDAYTGSVGVRHNGKTGRVAALRNGKAAVVYDGESIETPPQHEIIALQKLV